MDVSRVKNSVKHVFVYFNSYIIVGSESVDFEGTIGGLKNGQTRAIDVVGVWQNHSICGF